MEEWVMIGTAARLAGCKVQTVRYYESIGLLQAAVRTQGNQRQFSRGDVDRLTFIRHSRELGFPIGAIRDLLKLSDRPAESCETADAIARGQLDSVIQRIERLQALKSELERMIAECTGGRVAECRVIEVLSDHAHCRSDHRANGLEKSSPQ